MAKTPAAVEAFFARLIPSAVKKTKEEAGVIQAQMNKQNAGNQVVGSLGLGLFRGADSQEKYDLDETK